MMLPGLVMMIPNYQIMITLGLVDTMLGQERTMEDIERLREIERRLREQGYLTDRMELSPKAIRRIGQTALRRVFGDLDPGSRGDHDVHSTGASGELTGSTREWRFGDEQPIDVVRSVSNAVRRHVAERATGSIRLSAEDFEVRETETRTQAAVALLVDQSFSMVMNDTWRPAKTTALALHALASTSFPLDAMQIISFANLARTVAPHELPDLDAADIQGTNLHHALMLAGRFFDRHRGAQPVCLVVTDGEPTAHLMPDGDWWFMWPPDRETIEATVAEVDRLTRRGVPISWFRLGDDPRLERFFDHGSRGRSRLDRPEELPGVCPPRLMRCDSAAVPLWSRCLGKSGSWPPSPSSSRWVSESSSPRSRSSRPASKSVPSPHRQSSRLSR